MPTASKGTDFLQKQLFSAQGNVFVVIDGAAMPDLLDGLYKLKPPFECLYRGELQPDIAEVAPYLVLLEKGSAFTNWLLLKDPATSFGIYLVSSSDLLNVRRHLRRFLTVHTEEGKPMLFRFYDPRVLTIFLPNCTPEELTNMFGPVESYLVSDGVKLTSFEMSGPDRKLVQKTIPLVAQENA